MQAMKEDVKKAISIWKKMKTMAWKRLVKRKRKRERNKWLKKKRPVIREKT